MRMTRQKRCIREVLTRCPKHPTANDVWVKASQVMPRVSLATVYRCLEQMADHGELLRVFPAVGPRRYDTNPVPHAHVTCTECGAVDDVHLPPEAATCLNQLSAAAQSTFDLQHLELSWTGICPDCRKRRREIARRDANDRSRPPWEETC